MKNFIVIILLSFLMDGVFGAEEIKEVTEGDSLTLPTGLTETQSSGRILWLYETDGTIIAKIDEGTYSTNDEDERFKGNLELDKQTGSLTIKKIRMENSGLYKLDINRGTISKKFSVKVYASLPTPDIDSPQCAQTPAGSSSPGCVFQCSVQASDQRTLYWYRGNGVVSKKVSDVCNSSISLRLEVNYEDKDIYSCMVKNPISNKTKHLDITQFCKPCEEPGLSPGAKAGIAGIVVGVLLLLVFAVAAFGVYLLKIPKRQKQTTETVLEGESVILKPVTEINKGDRIQLIKTSGDKDTAIAEIKGGTEEIIPDGRFKDRLEVDKKTGSFTITDTRTEDNGLYKILIRRDIRTLYEEFYISVTVTNEVRKISVKEGQLGTLNPETEIQKDDLIQWRFGDQDIVMAEIRGGTGETHDDDGRFRGRLKLDEKTGSLTITDMRPEHAGVYKLKISNSRETTHMRFVATVFASLKLVEEGKPLNLKLEPEIQKDDLIQWRFGDQDILIAEIRGGTVETHDDDGRFRGRLKLNEKTGSLNIADMRNEHNGHYKLQIISSRGPTNKTFKVIVAFRSYTYKRVKEGENITLSSYTYRVKDEVKWFFNDEILATGKDGDINKTTYCDERFKGRLELDHQTGSLTIKNIRISDSGFYNLNFLSLGIERNFAVTVYGSHEEMKDDLKADIFYKKLEQLEAESCYKKLEQREAEKRVNDSVTVKMPPVNEEDQDAGNEHEGMRLLVMR